MIVRERISTKARVSAEVLMQSGALQGVARKMGREIKGYANDRGIECSGEAISFRVGPIDQTTHTHPCWAEWHPLATEPVELLGGPMDGATVHIEGDGPERYTFPLPASRPTIEREDVVPRVALTTCTYQRAGINDTTERWVYEFVA